jgi:hypothetical protein
LLHVVAQQAFVMGLGILFLRDTKSLFHFDLVVCVQLVKELAGLKKVPDRNNELYYRNEHACELKGCCCNIVSIVDILFWVYFPRAAFAINNKPNTDDSARLKRERLRKFVVHTRFKLRVGVMTLHWEVQNKLIELWEVNLDHLNTIV